MIGNRTVFKIIIWQIVLVLAISLVLGWMFTFKTGISFILGGAISILPGLLFARIFLKTTEVPAAKKVVKSFFYGEVVKWLVSLGLFILVFRWKGLQMIPLFLGIIVAQLVYWVAFIRQPVE